MSTELQTKDDADRALDLLLAGLPEVDEFWRSKLRIAYGLGRTDQAAQNYDSLLKSIKGDGSKELAGVSTETAAQSGGQGD